MKILWITNIIFPALCKVLSLPKPHVGGWMYGLAGQLVANSDIKLAVATVYKGNELKIFQLEGIRYFLLPHRSSSGYQNNLEPLWKIICRDFSPDIIHIHGTECPHGLACMRVYPKINYVVSIQGLVGICARYYYAGLTTKDILTNITLRDILRWDTLFHGKRSFATRGIIEVEYIRRAKHVIGRTSWDHSHVMAINPDATYYFCNETLRDGFYLAEKWDSNNKTNHSIFLSQAEYPIKGLHQVLKAVSLLKTEFPEIQICVAGHNILNKTTMFDRLKFSGYGSYLIGLIKKLGMEGRVKFIGPLSEEKMIVEYRKAHLFICSSSVENSPNSVGEAQLLGVPIIASFVGGVPDMITHGETGLLYRFEEVEMLAENIRQVFIDNHLTQRLSRQSIIIAEQRHNRIANCAQTINIYDCIAD
ncbi:MAG TPA: glycosyl transferase family 1 [Bacteroidetes bacterium]|nr:glycosyl transferase family 1 [Bacteroidota bacterium]